jgi:molybdenum cofactor biosynthesis enzyme MoaA
MGTAPEGNQMSKAVVKWTRATLVEVADKDTYTREEMDEVLLQGVAFVNGLSKAIEDRVYDQYGQSGLPQQVVNAIREAVEVENERQYRLHPVSVNDVMEQQVNDLVAELGLLSSADLDGKDFICESDVDTKIEDATRDFVSLQDMTESLRSLAGEVEEISNSLTGRINIMETSLAMQNEDLRERVASLEKLVIRLSSTL